MFYQNSNDLVKQASANSGHIQNSSATQQQIIHQGAQNVDVNNEERGGGGGGGGSASLNLGALFQKAMNNIIGSFSSIEEGLGNPPSVATPGTGPVGAGGDKTQVLNDLVTQTAAYDAQEKKHKDKVNAVISLVDADNSNSRGTWTQVTDTAGVSKYGYVTKDRIFQIWLAPSDPKNNPQNWFETSPVKQNGGVLGCPVTGGNLTKFQIDAKWDEIKPFDMVYAKGDTSRKTPLFMLTNDGVRDVKRSPGSSGLFSCGNERTNVFVKERPSADFDTSIKTNRQGCYIVDDKATDRTFKDRGFVFQEDMANASISQCKRRAEDLGSSYFLVSAAEPGGPENRGGCWIYTGSGEPKLDDILTFNTSQTKCHMVGTSENDEDGFMKAYTTTILKRMYGKNHMGDSTSYVSKGDGLWAGEGPDEYTCSGAKGRNTSGGFDRYCIFYTAEDAKNWCSSDQNCLGIVDGYNKYQPTKRPVVSQHGGKYFEKSTTSTTSRAVALYSLKKGGPTGVDATDRNGRGVVGRIAYIDHNGERHDYPESALSYMKSGGAGGAGGAGAMKYVNVGPYDTRSAESSYSLKEITPGAYTDAANLLYKASRDGWSPAAFHQRCDNKGATYTRAIINDGKVLGAYTSLSWSSSVQAYRPDPTAFLYDGTNKFTPNNGVYGADPPYSTYMNSSYMPTFGGGHDFHLSGQSFYNNAQTFLTDDKKAPFGREARSYQSYTLSDLEVYAVDATSFPKTLDYARRVRTMPIGESITASMEKCQAMCDGDEKCGGFVYSKGGGGADGKCELKDKTKMYPVGLRVADPTKQLMLKVPAINGTIEDPECAKSGKGQYNMIDSAQYQYYPDGGAMSSGTKCNLANIVPKEGNLTMPATDSAAQAVSSQFAQTDAQIAAAAAQTNVPGATNESFITLREGIETDISGSTYGTAMAGVSDTLKKIGNAAYQRERLTAIKDESNKRLISESYKFILWSILAILAVMALLKIKEMFGQDDPDDAGAGGDAGAGAGAGAGGILGFITSLFGMKAVNLDDIADRTGDVKAAIANAGTTIQQTGENLATGITQGADNLVNSVNEAATNAIDGARNMAGQVSEKAAEAVNSIGETVSGPGSGPGGAQNNVTTGGRRRIAKHHK